MLFRLVASQLHPCTLFFSFHFLRYLCDPTCRCRENPKKMNKESKIHLALVAGLFATGGGVCAKLAGFYEMVDVWNSLAKIILLLTMITSNTLGNTLFVKAMAGSGSSLPATVTSSTVNYFCSALMGFLFFGEKSSIRWWFGTSLVLLGLVLIGYSPAAAPQFSSKEQQRQQQQQLLEKEKEERKRQ